MRYLTFSFIISLVCLFSNITFALPSINSNVLQLIQKKDGVMAMRRVKSWQELIANNKSKTPLQKLKLVNDFFNRLTYVTDQALVGKEDYWMTPVEFLIKGAGDCEDFAIAKYFTLKELGISDDNLQIVYVKALNYNMAHMVLAYYQTPSSDPLILDSLSTKISPASQRPDLLPIYSFNGAGLWLAKQHGAGMGEAVGTSQQLSAWQTVLKRMNHILDEI